MDVRMVATNGVKVHSKSTIAHIESTSQANRALTVV